jgi:hypothetical protein
VDELERIELGDESQTRPTYVKAGFSCRHKDKLCSLLKEFMGCFAWNYTEMPGLSREPVEHTLLLKSGFRPHKQPARGFSLGMVKRIKEEVDQLLEAKFIRTCRYAKWVSNVVHVEKKNAGKIRVCVDFCDLNRPTPKDEYPMPVADDLINKASGHKVISFLDGNAGYNQIFMAEKDISKTAVHCLRSVGLFEWVVMTFGLKNARATYQRAMNLIFHDLLGVLMEVYIDDLVIKSADFDEHLADLRVVFERMEKYNLKMNPLKCAFGVTPGMFLGFVVHEKGLEVVPKKVESINKIKEPECKHDLQKLLGKVNYLLRFIANLAGKVDSFLPLIRLKNEEGFVWGEAQKTTFRKIKEYLVNPPVLRAPKIGVDFRLYIAAQEHVIGVVARSCVYRYTMHVVKCDVIC